MKNSKTLKKALDVVFKELSKLNDKELEAEIEKHKDGDITNLFLRAWKGE